LTGITRNFTQTDAKAQEHLAGENDKLVYSVLMLIIEAWLFIVAIQYWWWGQIYGKTGILLSSAMTICMIMPSVVFGKNTNLSLNAISRMLLIPSIIAFGFILAFRFGFTDYFGRYIYRSSIMMIIFGICFLGMLFAKWWFIHSYTIRDICQRKIRKGLPEISLILDLLFTAGFALLITNIEGIMQWLYSL